MTELPVIPNRAASYGFFHDPIKFLSLLLTDRPLYKADPKYSDAIKLASSFIPGEYARSESGELLLAYAERKFEQTSMYYDRTEQRRDEFTKLALGILTATFAAVGTMKLPTSIGMWIGVALLLLSLTVLILSRRSLKVPSQPNIHAIREMIVPVKNPHDWFAAVLHQAERGIQVGIDIRAAQLNVAIWLMTSAIIVLVASLFYAAA